MKMIKKIMAVALCSILCAGCASGSWWGAEKKPGLPGERIKVSTSKQDLYIAPALSTSIFVTPQPQINTEWSKSSGAGSSLIDNLYLNLPLNKQNTYNISSFRDFILSSTPIIETNHLYISSASGTIEAFNTETGEALWTNNSFVESHGSSGFSLFSNIYLNGGLLYNDGLIYATAGLAEVIAIKAEKGELVWKVKLSSPTRSTPINIGDIIIIQTVDNKTFALKATTGEIVWTHLGVGDEVSMLTTYAPAIAGKNIIVQYSSGEIFALDASSGSELWAANISSQSNNVNTEKHLYNAITSPTVVGSLVLAFGNDGTIAALHLNNGNITWKKDIGVSRQFWVSGDYIYAVTNNDRLICMRKSDGLIRWITGLQQYLKEEDTNTYWGAPIVADSKVIIVNSEGKMFFFDMATGEKVKDMVVDEEVYLMPIVVNGSMYLLNNDGNIARYAKE